MELSYWIYFKPGEKDKLKQIIEDNPNPLMANMAIQEEFGVSLTDAEKIIEVYNNKINKTCHQES
nr:MAG TPA: hypothetical protein [Caudoviricetes sp.]